MEIKHSITPEEFVNKYRQGQLQTAQIIDVREQWEWELYHLQEATLIPMNTIPENVDQIDDSRDVYIICAHGVRSWHVTNFLLQQGKNRVINVEGGMAEIGLLLQNEKGDTRFAE